MNFRFLGHILLFVGLFALISCSSLLHPSEEMPLIIYPKPPDSTRIQYLTSISSSTHIAKHRTKFAKFVLGEPEVLPINKPYGIAIHESKIYICDLGIDGLDIMDLKNGTFSYFIPEGKGLLKTPINCTLDKDHNLYIADRGRQQILVFDKEGKFTSSIGSGNGFNPTDVFYYDDKIWVSNPAGHNIMVYKLDSVLVTHPKNNETKQYRDSIYYFFDFPNAEIGSTEYLSSPSNIFVTDDKVYVSDLGDCSVKVFTTKGEYLSFVGGNGAQVGQFVRPKGIAVDRENNLYVIDAAFENAQIFNQNGDVLMFFGGSYKGPGDMWLPAKIAIDYSNISYFKDFVDSSFEIKYLIFVTNQFGPSKVNVYAAVKPKHTK